jgi:hypothetical protein
MSRTPPALPDPFEILNSAVADTKAGAHADALAKFLWFHNNSLQHNAGLSGVRLSFALAYWMDLGKVYSPAQTCFIRTRDETEAAFANNLASFQLFHDLAALNRELGDGLRTAGAFASVATWDPSAARRLYHVAEPFLVAAGRYDECGPFLDPPERMQRSKELYEVNRRWEETEPLGKHRRPPMARKFYEHDVATLIALLALNHRAEEAGWVRDQALAIVDDEEFRLLLAAAMSGHLPQPLLG